MTTHKRMRSDDDYYQDDMDTDGDAHENTVYVCRSLRPRLDAPEVLLNEMVWKSLCEDVIALGNELVGSPHRVLYEIENGGTTQSRYYAFVDNQSVHGTCSTDLLYGLTGGDDAYRSLSLSVDLDGPVGEHTTAMCKRLCDVADVMWRLRSAPGFDVRVSKVVFNGMRIFESA